MLFAYQCVEKDPCITEYHLRFDTSITPERDTISLNDTLWFRMRIGDSLFDIYSQQWIPSNRVIFPLYFSMVKLDSTGYQYAEEMFEFVPRVGTLTFIRLSQFTNIKIGMEKRTEDNYIEFGFIPKRSGIFKVTPYMHRFDIETIAVGTGECRAFVKDVSKQMNNSEGNNGFHLIRTSGSPAYSNFSELDYRKSGSFTFIVMN